MKRYILSMMIMLVGIGIISSQKYFTKSGTVSFVSKTPMENIEGVTKSGNAVLDLATGNVEMAVLVKSFIFEKALMQEHFNENYMESTKFPKAVFKGNITNMKDFTMSHKGSFKGNLVGKLTLHGVTKDIDNVVNIHSKDGKLTGDIDFNVHPKDFDIKIPDLVKDNIAKEIKVTVSVVLEELKKAQ